MIPPHSHHAIQIVIGIEGEVAIAPEGGELRSSRGVIVMQDVVHTYRGQNALGAMMFVDPESAEGIWLRTSLPDDITMVPVARIERCTGELRTFLENPLEGMEVGALVRHCVSSLCTGAPPIRKLDPRITAVLKAIRESKDLRISLEGAAASVFLSPSRFAHLFRQQVGLPFRRYMLWRKLTRAMLSVGREKTLTAAAYASDFADAAHLTRTFQQMFGIPPSVMMRGEFFEIDPPFEVAGSQ